jgi:hypothetical protein
MGINFDEMNLKIFIRNLFEYRDNCSPKNSLNAINLIFCEIPNSGNLLYLERSQKMHLSSD